MPEGSKKRVLEKRKKILCAVKNYIDENLNPKKKNILDPRKKHFSTVPSTSEIYPKGLL